MIDREDGKKLLSQKHQREIGVKYLMAEGIA
jgi:hypothetical protein